MPFSVSARAEEIARFEREARAAASLHHPHICTVFGFYKTESALEIIGQLAAAFEKGVVHRDIKSDNIMVLPSGRVKIMDFGLGALKNAPTITKTGDVLGTVAYMSPEQVEGRRVDHRSVQYVIYTLLEKNPAYRYQSAGALLKDLRVKVEDPTRRLVLRSIRKNALKLALAFVFLSLAGMAVNGLIQGQRNRPPWLKPGAQLVRLTSETGDEMGHISPDGRTLAYRNNKTGGKLCIRNLSTGEVRKILEYDLYTHHCPRWSADGSRIAFTGKEACCASD